MTEPVCRTCYLRSLPHDEMVRIAVEPITMPVHYCPEHQQRANEIEALFTKMVAEGKVIWHGSITGRFPREPEPQFPTSAHVHTPGGECLGVISQAMFEDVDLDRWENEGGCCA
jgi:hypothetical protein